MEVLPGHRVSLTKSKSGAHGRTLSEFGQDSGLLVLAQVAAAYGKLLDELLDGIQLGLKLARLGLRGGPGRLVGGRAGLDRKSVV